MVVGLPKGNGSGHDASEVSVDVVKGWRLRDVVWKRKGDAWRCVGLRPVRYESDGKNEVYVFHEN